MANEVISALQACRAAKDQVDAMTYAPALDTATRNALQGISIDLDQAERILLLNDLAQKIQEIRRLRERPPARGQTTSGGEPAIKRYRGPCQGWRDGGWCSSGRISGKGLRSFRPPDENSRHGGRLVVAE